MTSSSGDAVELAAWPPKGALGGWLAGAAWTAAALALLVGLYAALGYWAAPRFVRSQTIRQIERLYHRRARLDAVRIDPFALRLDARGFELPDADGAPMLGFDRLVVRLSPASLWRSGLAFREIELTAPHVRGVLRADGRLNLADLLLPPSREPPGRPLKIMIDHLSVRRGQVQATDLARPTPLTESFGVVDFSLEDFTTVRDGAEYVLTARTPRGEELAWRGVLGVSPIASNGAFQLTGVQLAPLAALAGEALPFALSGGKLDLTGRYRFSLTGDRPALTADVEAARLTATRLRPRDERFDWIVLPVIDLDGAHIDAAARTVSIGRIEASQPLVTAWLAPGSGLNLIKFVPAAGPAAAPGASAGAGAPAASWSLSVQDLKLTGGRLAFEDRTASTAVSVRAEPVEVEVTGLAWPAAGPVQIRASAQLNDGGRLAAEGSIGLAPLTAHLQVKAERVDLRRLQPYLDDTVSLRLVSGDASGAGRLDYDPRAGIRFDGALEIDRVHTLDTLLGQDFVDWSALRFEGVRLRTAPLSLRVREVTARQPYAKVVIGPNYVMNIKTVLTTKPGQAPAARAGGPRPAAAGAAANGLPIEIGRVVVDDGRMDFSDLSVQPHFAAGVQKLAGTVTGLSGRQDARAMVDLKGQVDPYAPVTIAGQLNYFAVRNFTDLRMDFHNIEMTTFTPYSGKFAGYRIDKGKMDVGLHYRIDDQKLDAMHHVVLNQLQLGDKVDSAQATHLPVKLIVALLKDRHGVIDLPIEVTGTLDDPNFRVWPLIWRMVGNLLEKVATAPFTLLGKLAGGGGEELSYVDFAPGAASLDETGRRKLQTLGAALAERPALNLDIPITIDPQADRPALVEARLAEQIAVAAVQKLGRRAAAPGAVQAALAAPKPRRSILEALYRARFGVRPVPPRPEKGADGARPDVDRAANAWLESRLRERISVDDKDLAALGQARARAAQDMLLGDGKVAASRVFITAAAPLSGPTPRMSLALH